MANANYNYSLNVGATIKSTDNLKTQLDAFANKYQMKIEVKLSENQLSKLNQNLNTATNAMNDLRRATNEASQDMRGINANASDLNRTLTSTATDVRSVSNGIQNLTTVTENSSSVMSTSLDRIENNIVDVELATYTVGERLEEVGTRGVQSLNRLSRGTQDLQHHTLNFGNVLGRVLEFYVASLPVRVFETMVRETITTITEFDKELTEFKKVSDLSGESLQEYTEKLGELGETVGRVTSQMVSSATEFRKSGYSDEDSAQLAQIANMYMNIADEELEAGEAASFVIAQLKAFYPEAEKNNTIMEDSMHIIDAVNEVSNKFAVSSADLSENVGKISAALGNAGNSYEELLGMTTAITETTRSASTAVRGLRMTASRLMQVLDESSTTGKKLKQIYSDLGIELLNEDGQLRSTYDILKDLSDQWDNLSTNEKDYIALTSSGANQIQNFTALMNNFSQAVEATQKAEESAGSAERENARYMESLAA